MDIKRLAAEAATIMEEISYALSNEHGIEVAPGFFNIYNKSTGQARVVLYHPESDLIFKSTYFGGTEEEGNSNSKKILGSVELFGRHLTIRFPFLLFLLTSSGRIEVQEYVHGTNDPCLEIKNERGYSNAWCEHAAAVRQATGLTDTHSGNWKIVGDEIIVFDH
jgi:hypothetical protein